MRQFLVGFLLMVVCPSIAQSTLERQVLSRLEKKNWNSAEEQLRKSIRKDSLNPEAKFLLSIFYFREQNPSANIDSSYSFLIRALQDLSVLSEKEKEKLRRWPIDSGRLTAHLKRIDSVAFENAKRENSERSYEQFLSGHPYSDQRTRAVELRDEVAFLDALKLNTHSSFLNYLSHYPASHRANEARQKYNKLLFEEGTRDGSLRSFESFYRNNPASPYRTDAERNIFEIMTAGGSPASFLTFIKNFPNASLRSRAEGILYHLAKEDEIGPVSWVLGDSLKNIQATEQSYWVPVFRNGKFGFMDRSGAETLAPQFDSVLPEYLCGGIKSDFLVVGGGVIGRSGRWIVQGAVLEAVDAGSGFLKVNTGNCTQVVHKSGYKLEGPCYADAKVIAHSFIAVKDHLKWGLKTLTGRWLQQPLYDDISSVDGMVMFMRNGKKVVATREEVAGAADQHPMPISRVFDDLQALGMGDYLVKNGALEGVVNGALEFKVSLDRQVISRVQSGLVLRRDQKYLLAGVSDKLDGREFRKFQFYGDWLKLEEDKNLQLYQLSTGKTISSRLDSLWFENEIAFASRHDSLRVFLKSGLSLEFGPGTKVTFIKSVDSTSYFFALEKKKMSVFNARHGARLFSFDFDEIEYTGNGIFMVTFNGKKGLVSDKGKVILPLEYSAIIYAGPGMLSLLKDKHFGMYNLATRKLLKTSYERNVIPFSSRWLVAYKEGGYGFVSWDAQVQGKFEFEEVQAWNDTSALVKKKFQWAIYGIRSQRILVDRIKDYRFIRNTPTERVAIVHRDNYFGVMGNQAGEVLPATFSDIINVGSDDHPLYFVEKNVEEASIYVVIYYDERGKLLRKQVYEEEEYEKILCGEK